MDTELKLLHWRDGQTKAERLCANLLDLDGFHSIDPQSPLGGPDGLKDMICEKNGWKYIGAAYFPTTTQDFKSIKKKFQHDLKGIEKNQADGLVFLTNQKLTPSERKILVDLAIVTKYKAIIFHIERIRVLLDSPIGFALRLEYLAIEMSLEEQLSFFSEQRNYLKALLKENSEHIIKSISDKIENTNRPPERFSKIIDEIYDATQNILSSIQEKPQRSDKRNLSFPTINIYTSELTSESVRFIHKALLFGTRGMDIGEFRKTVVWIKTLGNEYVAPNPQDVPTLLKYLLERWNSKYKNLYNEANVEEILDELTYFHHQFLLIHPFMDGNGRVARFILTQQVSELLRINRQIILEDKFPYFNALEDADKGRLGLLKSILKQAIFGIEET